MESTIAAEHQKQMESRVYQECLKALTCEHCGHKVQEDLEVTYNRWNRRQVLYINRTECWNRWDKANL